jgi:hypothetical protein
MANFSSNNDQRDFIVSLEFRHTSVYWLEWRELSFRRSFLYEACEN